MSAAASVASASAAATTSPAVSAPKVRRAVATVAPSNLTAATAGSSSINLAWQATGTASRVAVFFRTKSSGAWTQLVSLRGGRQSYAVTGLKSGRYYTFYVEERHADGSTAQSSVAGASTAAATTSSPNTAPGSGSGSGSGTSSPNSITFSKPIVITHGGTYTGNWQTTSPDVPAVEIDTPEPVVIENSNLRGPGMLISSNGYDANITVRNTNGYGVNPNVKGRRTGRFLNVIGFTNIDLEHNYLQGTAGIYLENYTGNHTSAQTIKVLYNSALNIDGRYSNGKGGYLSTGDDNDYVQFFQTNGPQNLRGAEVAWNQVVNQPGQSLVEDNINIFDTTGTAASPFAIHDNYINGAYPVNPATDADFTGGGIMASDVGSAYVSAFNNTVLNTTNYGIAISSGHDNQIYDNLILSSGTLPDGTPVPTQNVGAYIWNQNNERHFTNNSGYGNVLGWVANGNRNDDWTPDAAAWKNNTYFAGSITNATIQSQFTAWSQKLAQVSVTVGPVQG